MMDDFGDRMKEYEAVETGRHFMPLLPVYARIDGRNFSRFTRGLDRPYDLRITRLMIETTKFLVAETHARIGYTQSDEISLVWLQERYDSEMFFGGKIHKITSILSALASSRFAILCASNDAEVMRLRASLTPHFDCRAFQLPSRVEAANAFLWREQDATKNAVSMAASAHYSHKQLDHKNSAQKQEMLFEKGVNFNDYPAFFKRGTFVRRINVERQFTADEVARIPEKHRPPSDQLITRSEIVELDVPPFTSVINREAFIFDGSAPETLKAAA